MAWRNDVTPSVSRLTLMERAYDYCWNSVLRRRPAWAGPRLTARPRPASCLPWELSSLLASPSTTQFFFLFVFYIPCLSTIKEVLFKNPWHNVVGAWHPKWPPLSRYSLITLDLVGLDTQTGYQFRLKLTFQTRLNHLFYVLFSYLMINPTWPLIHEDRRSQKNNQA